MQAKVDRLESMLLAYQAETDAEIDTLRARSREQEEAFATYKAESEVWKSGLGCTGSHTTGHHCAADGPDRDADAGVSLIVDYT